MTTMQAKFEKARYRMVMIRHSVHYEAQKEREKAFKFRVLFRLDRLQERRWMRT